jgi:hypothetical protein
MQILKEGPINLIQSHYSLDSLIPYAETLQNITVSKHQRLHDSFHDTVGGGDFLLTTKISSNIIRTIFVIFCNSVIQ